VRLSSKEEKEVLIQEKNGYESEEIRNNVFCAKEFPEFMSNMIKSIEENNFSCISTFCRKGRHRSVSCAIWLKKLYYPNATIEHLTIN